jgi:hypothetical protein
MEDAELHRQIDQAYFEICKLSHQGAASFHSPLHEEYLQAERRHLELRGQMYDTTDKCIALVAHRWNTQYRYDAEYSAMGFSDWEIRKGCELGAAREDEHYHNRCYYGDPSYGSWPARSLSDQPVSQLVGAMFRGDAMLLPDVPRKPVAKELSEQEIAA